MTVSIISLLILFLTSCANDFTVSPRDVTEIIVQAEDTSPTTEVVVDYFIQPSKPDSLDVLIVLDTSCSMADDYEKVSIGMELLKDDIEPLTNDYQMAIINSSLRGNYFVGPFGPTSNIIDLLLAPSVLSRDTNETPFASHYLFATDTSEGLEFLRPGVPKLMIYISDEEEQSPMSVEQFKDWLDEYHAGVDHDVITIAIKEYSHPDCMLLEGHIGYRYDQLSQYYNKRSVNFCGDWQTALADSSFLLSPVTYLGLSETPVEESIVVYQNGEEEDLWYYLPETNTVYFEFVLDEGSVIEVGYKTITE